MASEVAPSRGRAYSTEAAAEYVGLAPKTVRNLMTAGQFPKPHKNGIKNIWFADELDAYNRVNVSDYDEVHDMEVTA